MLAYLISCTPCFKTYNAPEHHAKTHQSYFHRAAASF
jgi:hypothetical protein